jgi:formylglycine-generating enzyme required for sulfatase activity
MRLEELPDGAFRLHLQPGSEPLSARSDERLRYPARSRRVEQTWLRFPVTGISGEDVEAYAAWLRATGRVPGARLCTELEWERAARGADDREFPHGNELLPDDADFDLTYAKSPTAMGLDETGSHPASRSPFELDDMSGNAFEWTKASLTPDQYAVRGGAFFFDKKTARVSNRQVTVASLRDATVGARICADAGGS